MKSQGDKKERKNCQYQKGVGRRGGKGGRRNEPSEIRTDRSIITMSYGQMI